MNAPPTGATAIELIRTLIGFNTVSRESNLELIHWVRDYLKRLGVTSRLTFDDARGKANLFATLGEDGDGGVVLSGHTDVVPVEGQPWDSDPFRLLERDGRLYGRGTADMKSFVACVLAAAPEILRRAPRKPLHVAFSYDEEVGCLGVRRLLEDIKAAGIKPAACIVGEPTLMRPVVAHKGKKAWRCTVRGHSSHSAYAPLGVNAVEAAAEVVAHLKGIARRMRDQGPHDTQYDVPYTTVHTGVMHGGNVVNIVPRECSFDFEVRYFPPVDADAIFAEVKRYAEERLLPEMQAVNAATGFTWEPLSALPGMDEGHDSELAILCRELGATAPIGKVSYGTEGGWFKTFGIPAVICGPGSIEQAHKANEYVALDQVAQCEAFLAKLLDRVCATREKN